MVDNFSHKCIVSFVFNNFRSCVNFKAKIFNENKAKNKELINLKIDLIYTTELIYSFMAKFFFTCKKGCNLF